MPGLLIKWRFGWCMSHFLCGTVVCFLTSGLTDHDVAVFTLSPIIKALHLNIIGGLRLEMSNHVPVFYTWGGWREGGGKKADKGEKSLPVWAGVDSHRSKSCVKSLFLFPPSPSSLHVSHLHGGHVLSCSRSHSPPSFSLLQHPHPSLLLRQSHEGPDSCFTLDKLHIWQLHVCPGLPPVFTHTHTHTHATGSLPHTITHYYVLCNHRWDHNLSHGNATFPTNKAEISCYSCCVLFNKMHMSYKVDLNSFEGAIKESCC